jgi:hypothetical protein
MYGKNNQLKKEGDYEIYFWILYCDLYIHYK